MNFYAYARLLNLSKPNRFEGCSIFCLPIADYEKEDFFSLIDKIIENTIFFIRGEMLEDDELRMLYSWFMLNKGTLTISQLAADTGFTISEAKELLWRYTQLGVLRYEEVVKAID